MTTKPDTLPEGATTFGSQQYFTLSEDERAPVGVEELAQARVAIKENLVETLGEMGLDATALEVDNVTFVGWEDGDQLWDFDVKGPSDLVRAAYAALIEDGTVFVRREKAPTPKK